jgi:hypothetical protein
VPVAANCTRTVRNWFRALGPLKYGDLVVGVDQARDEESTDEARAADDEDAHDSLTP